MFRRIAAVLAVAVLASGAVAAGPSEPPDPPEAPTLGAGPAAKPSSPAPARLGRGPSLLDELGGAWVDRSLDSLTTPAESPPALSQALDAVRARRYRRAVTLVGGAAELTGADRARAQLVAAIAHRALGAHRAAGQAFSAAADAPELAFYARWQAARELLAAGEPELARQALAAIPVAERTPELAILRARVAHALGDVDDAERWYRRAATAADGSRDAAEAALGLAELAESRGANADELVAAFRRVAELGPGTRYAARAEIRLRALGARAKPRPASVAAARAIAAGHAQLRRRRNRPAERRFRQALRTRGLSPQQACEASYYQADSAFRQRVYDRAAPLFAAAVDTCRDAGEVDLEVKAAYQAGRALLRDERPVEAAAAFANAEAHPSHSYADDARVLQAEALDAAGQTDRATALLASTPTAYPEGDRVADARWRLAWRAYLAGDNATALSWLERHQYGLPRGEPDDARARYWTARVHAALGHEAEALSGYLECAERFPLGYYALQSLMRLRERAPTGYNAVIGSLRAPPSAPPPMSLSWPALLADPAVRGAIQLLRLGLDDEALALLEDAGQAVGRGRELVDDTARAERLWLAVYLHDRAGRHSRAVWITRWHLRTFRERWPFGPHDARWRLAFPRGYWDLVTPASEAHGYPALLQLAIMREESGFAPTLESWANAIGLTQMIMPTARRFGRGTGMRVNRRTLRKPEVNVAVGSRFLGFLWSTFEGRVGLLVPAYNAGEARVWRWMRDRHRPRLDEWIESIPGDQARRYSKRVLGSYFAYSFLYAGRTIPDLQPDVPIALIPQRFRTHGDDGDNADDRGGDDGGAFATTTD